jgi:hypothetical protein
VVAMSVMTMVAPGISRVLRMIVAGAGVQRSLARPVARPIACPIACLGPDGRNLLRDHGREHMTGLRHYKLHGDDIIPRL